MSHAKQIQHHLFGEYLAEVRKRCKVMGTTPPPVGEVKDAFDAHPRMSAKEFAAVWVRCDDEAARAAHRAALHTPQAPATMTEYKRAACRLVSPLPMSDNPKAYAGKPRTVCAATGGMMYMPRPKWGVK